MASAVLRSGEPERLVQVEISFEPIADASVLPDQDIAGEASALLHDLAVAVEQKHEVRLPAEEDAR